jgi:hypothetical protein
MPFRSSLAQLSERIRLSRSDLTPEEATHRSEVAAACRRLHDAGQRHATRVRAAKRQLHDAERAHASVLRSARKDVQRAERTAEGAIGEAGRKLPRPAEARELGAYGAFLLYEDRLDTGFGIVPLTSSFRAFVAAPPALGQTPPEVGAPDRIVDERGRRRRRLKAKRMYLVLQGVDTRLLVESRDEQAAWAFEVLESLSFTYDSSIFPVTFHDRYGARRAPRFAHTVGKSLLEIPLSTIRAMGCNWPVAGGGYFRIAPLALTTWAIQRINRQGNPAVVYLHPWEFDPQQPRIASASRRSKFRHYLNLHRTEARLRALLKQFAFAPIEEVYRERLRSGCDSHSERRCTT